jgi:hypothetical protein
MSTRPALPPTPSVSLSNFHLNFREAILTYNKRTKNDLLFHPLAPLFQSCNDPTLALSLLQRHAQLSPQNRISDEQLKTLLIPTLIGLYAISSGSDEGVGLVIVELSPSGREFYSTGGCFLYRYYHQRKPS